MSHQSVAAQPHPQPVAIEVDDAGPDALEDTRGFTPAQWNLFLTRVAKRLSRSRVDGKRACQLAYVSGQGLRAAGLEEEGEHKRKVEKHVENIDQRLERIEAEQRQPAPAFDYGEMPVEAAP